MNTVKKLVAGFLMIAVVIASITILPVIADAEENATIPTTVDYDNNYLIATYWEDREAPAKEGYVFGGWYTKTGETTYTPIKEADIVTNGVASYEGAYAKFVPSYVLSVRAQLEHATEVNETKPTETYLRVISGVDSTDYKNVGFDILFNKKTALSDEENAKTVLSKVYENIENANDGSMNATTVFGQPATHFSVLKINTIKEKNYEKVIYVTPYWTTMDGTKVEGLSKYVRVIDGYASNQYISIPVNLLTGDVVAAGKLQMAYDNKTLNYVGYDTGVLLPEMEVNVNKTTGIISVVGNGTDTTKNVEPESDIYVNVWFQKKTADEIAAAGATIPEHWQFSISNESFCNWGEELLVEDDAVKAWDVRY